MVRALAARNGRPSQLVPKPKPVPSNEKITAYFAIRKRAHDSKSDVDVLGKRLKNDVSFTEEEELYETPKEFSDNVLGRTLSFSDEKKENVSPPSTPLRGYDFRPVKSYLGQRLFDGSMPFSSMTPFGVFDELPRPGLHDFINLLPLESCCRLAMTSSHFAEEFMKYLKTSDATRRFMRLAEETNGDRPPRVFGFFGAFIKAATNLKDMTERVKFAVEFYARLKVFVPNEAGWGCFFQALADMWKFNEVVSLVYAVLAAEQYRLGNLVDEVVEAEPGENKANELAVRDELHALFLNERANEGMWIAAMLKTRLHAAEQGRLLMLLHAPTEVDDDGVKGIAWRSLCDTQVTSMADGEERLGPLAEALANLKPKIGVIKLPYAWTNTDLFNLIEEVTTFPEPWSFDNFVTLLLQVPTVLVPTSIVARMTHNFEEEAGQMFITMKTLLYRWNIDLATVEPAIMEIFRQLRSFDRDYTDDFVSSVMNAHFTAIEELVALTPNRNRVGFANNTAVLDENRSFKTIWGMMEKARAANNRK